VPQNPPLLLRVPQFVSLAIGLLVFAGAMLKNVAISLSILFFAAAVIAVVVRLWIPIYRRRKYGF